MVKVRKAIESLYEGLCAVYVQGESKDLNTKETLFAETAVFSDQPCRLSFSTITTTSEASHTAAIGQSVKLFISPDIEVPPGSKIIVTQNAVTTEYSNSGEPSRYVTHQEIPLQLFEGWA